MQQYQFKVTGPKKAVEELLKELMKESPDKKLDISEPIEEPGRVNQPELIDLFLSYVIGVAGNATYGWLSGWLWSRASGSVSVQEIPPNSSSKED